MGKSKKVVHQSVTPDLTMMENCIAAIQTTVTRRRQ